MFTPNTSLDHNRRVRRAEIAIYKIATGVFRDSSTVVAASACVAMIGACSGNSLVVPPNFFRKTQDVLC